jgi:ribose transport system ATP-binding protein
MRTLGEKANEQNGPVLFTMRGIGKSFGSFAALDAVDFDVRAGEVHALLGENGAGKSTLMNIMSGVTGSSTGEMRLRGNVVRFSSPAAAQSVGVATVFQELDLVPSLSVAANLFLGHEPANGRFFIDNAALVRRASDLLSTVGSTIDPTRLVRSLRLGEQQIVAIAKALSFQASVLVLDEPTAALPSNDVQQLFTLIRELRIRGVGIVYISHRLEEVPAIADRVTILRDGVVVATVAASTPQAELASLLIGRTSDELFPVRPTVGNEVRLQLIDYSYVLRHARPGWREPSHISLAVGKGEIVGLAGLLGSGRTELLESLFGAAPPGTPSGRVEVDGKAFETRNVPLAQRAGLAFVTDDRRGSGFVAQRNVAENLALSSLHAMGRWGLIAKRRVRETALRAMKTYGVKASSPSARMLSLSGGNQQKVVLARSLLRSPGFLLLDEPTRGVDVGAKAEIYRLLRRLTSDGLGVLVASSEMPELLGLCDRILVMQRGAVVAEFPAGSKMEEINAVVNAETNGAAA